MKRKAPILCAILCTCGIALAEDAPAGVLPIERLSVWGGEVDGADVVGNLLYMGSGPRFLIVDISDPGQPVLLGDIHLDNCVREVVVQGIYAYVAVECGDFQLSVVDVSDPTDPQLAASYGPPNCHSYIGLLVDGDVLYLGADNGFIVVDIADPLNAEFIAYRDDCSVEGCWGPNEKMALVDDVLFMSNSRWFRAVDVTDPSNPVHIASIPMPRGPNGMDQLGDYAYVTHTDGVSLVDISDPENMQIIGNYVLEFAHDVAVSGTTAYVASGDLHVVDVSDPTAPALIRFVETHGDVSGVHVIGDRAYVADKGDGMIILDISVPTDPVWLGRVYSPAMIQHVALDGDRLYVSDQWNGLTIMDVQDPTMPEVLGAYLAGPVSWDILVRDDGVFLAGGMSGFDFLDVSDPANIVKLGGFPSGAGVLGFDIQDDLAVMGQTSPGPVVLLDVTNPEDPSFLSTIPRTQVSDVVIDGDYAFLAFGGGMSVADLSNVAAPSECYIAQPFAHGLHRVGSLLYAALWPADAGLSILDISVPCEPDILSTYIPQNGGDEALLHVEVVGRRAYCAGSSTWGLHILDVADAYNPVFLVEHSTAHQALHLVVNEPCVYLSDRFGGLIIFRVAAQGDADWDFDVDRFDFLQMFACLTGPAGGVTPECDDMDFYDVGRGIDLRDFSLFQENYTGEVGPK